MTNDFERYYIPFVEQFRYKDSVADWFSGFADFITSPQPQNTSQAKEEAAKSLEELLSFKAQLFQNQRNSLQELIQNRRSVEHDAVTTLQKITQKCRSRLLPLEDSQTPNNDLILQWEREIILCEKQILDEKLSSIRDCFMFYKMLWYLEKISESANRRYRLFQGL